MSNVETISTNPSLMKGEKQIVWLRDPVTFHFVRQSAIHCLTRDGLPCVDRLYRLRRFHVLAGYAELDVSTSPTLSERFLRRVFWINDVDANYDPRSIIPPFRPKDVIDPLTAAPGVRGWDTNRVAVPILTIQQAASVADVNPQTITSWIDQGILRGARQHDTDWLGVIESSLTALVASRATVERD